MSCAHISTASRYFATGLQIVVVGPASNPRTQELIRAVWGKALPNRLLVVVESGEALPAGHPAFGKAHAEWPAHRLSLPAQCLLAADHQRGGAQPGADPSAAAQQQQRGLATR